MASGGVRTASTDPFACTFTRDEMRRVVDRAHALGLPVTAHAHPVVAVEQVLVAGVDGIAVAVPRARAAGPTPRSDPPRDEHRREQQVRGNAGTNNKDL